MGEPGINPHRCESVLEKKWNNNRFDKMIIINFNVNKKLSDRWGWRRLNQFPPVKNYDPISPYSSIERYSDFDVPGKNIFGKFKSNCGLYKGISNFETQFRS